jgi:TolB protein
MSPHNPALRAASALFVLGFWCLGGVVAQPTSPHPAFEEHADVGKIDRPGSAEFDRGAGEYRVTGGGENMWGKQDAFHFVWRKRSGDVSLAAEVRFVGEGKNAHRKACLMVRQGLDADAPYADAAVHGDGLISLQFRREKGGATEEMQSKIKAPATVRLQREGDVFTLFVAPPGKPFEKAGSVTLGLKDAVHVGLAVCSHDASVSETAVFSKVELNGQPRKHDRPE